MTPPPNKLPAVDAAIPVLSDSGHPWRGTTEAGRWATFTHMKKHVIVSLALLVAGVTQAQTTKFETKGAPVSKVLKIYSTLSGKDLVIEPSATNQLKTITMHITATNALTEADAAKVIASELRKQADIVITPLDDKRASVKLVKK